MDPKIGMWIIMIRKTCQATPLHCTATITWNTPNEQIKVNPQDSLKAALHIKVLFPFQHLCTKLHYHHLHYYLKSRRPINP